MCTHFCLPYLCISDGSQVHGLELPRTLFILPEVSLTANQDDRNIPTEVPHLWEPLGKRNVRSYFMFVLFNIKFRITLFWLFTGSTEKRKSQHNTCMHAGQRPHAGSVVWVNHSQKNAGNTPTYKSVTIINWLNTNSSLTLTIVFV